MSLKPASCQIGERCGQFVVFLDEDGIRHAVRFQSIVALSDADANRDACLLQLPGGRFVRLMAGFEEVLVWFSGQTPAPSAARAGA